MWNRTGEKGLKCEKLDEGTKCNQSLGAGLRWEMACWKSGKELYRHPALYRATLKPSVWLQSQQARLGYWRVYPRLGIDFCWGRQKVSGYRNWEREKLSFLLYLMAFAVVLEVTRGSASLEVLPICTFPSGKRFLLNSNEVIGDQYLQCIIINKNAHCAYSLRKIKLY